MHGSLRQGLGFRRLWAVHMQAAIPQLLWLCWKGAVSLVGTAQHRTGCRFRRTPSQAGGATK